MELGINIEKIKANLKQKNFCRFCLKLLSAKARILIILAALSATGYCVNLWYDFIYKPQWDDARKQEYLNSKDKGTNFSRARFQNIVDEFKSRQDRAAKTVENLTDIFRVNK